jgi:hypothetical protein
MDKHREGRPAHERAEAKRRELRKRRAKPYPKAPSCSRVTENMCGGAI